MLATALPRDRARERADTHLWCNLSEISTVQCICLIGLYEKKLVLHVCYACCCCFTRYLRHANSNDTEIKNKNSKQKNDKHLCVCVRSPYTKQENNF